MDMMKKDEVIVLNDKDDVIGAANKYASFLSKLRQSF